MRFASIRSCWIALLTALFLHCTMPAFGQTPTATPSPQESLVNEICITFPDFGKSTNRFVIGINNSKSMDNLFFEAKSLVGSLLQTYAVEGDSVQLFTFAVTTRDLGGSIPVGKSTGPSTPLNVPSITGGPLLGSTLSEEDGTYLRHAMNHALERAKDAPRTLVLIMTDNYPEHEPPGPAPIGFSSFNIPSQHPNGPLWVHYYARFSPPDKIPGPASGGPLGSWTTRQDVAQYRITGRPSIPSPTPSIPSPTPSIPSPTPTIPSPTPTIPTPGAPTVIFTAPAINATITPVNSKLSATFSEPMDPKTLIGATFTVTGPGATPVPGAVTCPDSTATFTPTNKLPFNTAFNVTITTDAKDLDGNALAEKYVWTFMTEGPPPPPDKGFPWQVLLALAAVVAVVAMLGNRAVAVTVSCDNDERPFTVSRSKPLVIGGVASGEINHFTTDQLPERLAMVTCAFGGKLMIAKTATQGVRIETSEGIEADAAPVPVPESASIEFSDRRGTRLVVVSRGRPEGDAPQDPDDGNE